MESFFQTDAWAAFKQKAGWTAERVDGRLALRRALPLGQVILYFPELPDSTAAKEIVNQLDRAKQTFARLEFLEVWSDSAAASLKKLGFIKSFEEVQPEHRQWVDLTKSEADILTQMKPKGRYNVRLAEKHNLIVERGAAPALVRRFFKLYETTSARSRFAGRDEDYFQQLMKVLAVQNVGEVILVKKGHEDLAAGIFLYFGTICSYLYGGSGGDRTLMAPYLLHWEAMKTAKAKKLTTYDLLAVAPPDEPNHPYAGLTRFKTQFGGQTVRLLGSWDLVGRPSWYKLYQFAERLRRRSSTQ